MGVFETNREGRLTFANHAAWQMFGLPAGEELCFLPCPGFIVEKDRALVVDQLRQAFGGNAVPPVDCQTTRVDGTRLSLRFRIQPLRSGPRMTGVRGVVTDITEWSRRTESALQESQERFAKAFHSSPGPMVISDIETGQIIDVNDKWLEMLGFTREEAIGRTAQELGIYADPQVRDLGVSELSQRRHFREIPVTFVNKSGQHRRALWSAELINFGTREVMLSLIYDHEERKRAEDALRATQERLRLALDVTGAGVWEVDLRTGRVTVDARTLHNLGYAPEDSPKTMADWSQLHHPDDRPLLEAAFEGLLRGEAEVYQVEQRNRRKDGTWSWADVRGVVAERSCDGAPVRIIGTHVDITPRKQVEAALLASEDRARRQRTAIAELFLDKEIGAGELPAALHRVTRKLAETLRVGRASVWMLSENDLTLQCLSLFEATTNLHSAGAVLPTADFPAYFEAIRRDSRLTTTDALIDPRTSSIASNYLRPLGIASLLDTGIQAGGRLVGVVSAEHVGPARTWHPDEEAFAGTVAALVAEILANAKRRRAEQVVRRLSELGRQLGAASHANAAAEAVADAADDLLGWDACFLKLRSADQAEGSYVLSVDLVDGKRRAIGETTGREVTEIERRVMEHGAQLILRENPHQEERFVMFGDVSRPTASLIFVPLRYGGNYLGMFSIQSYRCHAYTRPDLDLLQALADHAAGALERIRAEEAFHESEHRYGMLVNSMKDILYSLSTDGRIRLIGPQVRAYGHSDSAMIGQDFLPFIHSEDQQAVLRDFQRTVSTGEETQSTFRFLSKDGSIHWFEEIGRAVRDKAGNIVAVTGMLRDITERKRSEEALQLRNVLLLTQQEASIDGILAVDENGRILSHNQRFTSMWKLPEDLVAQGIDEPILQLVASQFSNPQAFLRRVRDLYAQRQETGRDELILADGRIFDRYSAPMFGPDHRYYGRAWYFRDITRRKQLEAQLRQAQKLEAIGQLAGGVAHDFNNILAAIMMNLGLLRMSGALDEETRKGLKDLETAAQRAATLTRQLLMFSRRSVLTVAPLSVNEVVANLLKMLERLIGEQIDLRFDGKTGLPSVEADAGMLEQVLMNLVVNARDAMPAGGRLTVSTTFVELGTSDVSMNPDRRPGRFVCLAVSDTGTGMDAETMKRIFEPFFTTKEPGKGTGLGLATVYGIVAQHKGWVEVESQLRQGTSFRVFLPAMSRQFREAAPEAQPEPLVGGREAILLVEDDTNARQTIGQALRVLGYRVFEATNGQQAVALWLSHGGCVDLLLTDMVMPGGMTGLQLTEKLRDSKPGLKAIISSGYSAEIVHSGIPAKAGVVYLPKPYQTGTLARVVRACLDGKL